MIDITDLDLKTARLASLVSFDGRLEHYLDALQSGEVLNLDSL